MQVKLANCNGNDKTSRLIKPLQKDKLCSVCLESKIKGTKDTNCPHPAACGAGREREMFSPSKGTGADSPPGKLLLQPGVLRQGGLCTAFPVAPCSPWNLPSTSTDLQTRERQKEGTAIVFPIAQNAGTEPTSPGGFKLRPGTMKHPGQCVQTAIGCLTDSAQPKGIGCRTSREGLVHLQLRVCTARLVVTHQKSNPWGNCH